MGTNTAETPEVSTEEEPVVDVEQPETEKPDDAGEVSDDGEDQQQEPVELEVVRSGEDGSQPDTQHGIRKRVNKLNAKVAKAEDTASDAENRLAIEQEKNKLLSLALEQKTPAEMSTPPDPADFDDGVRDPKYAQALDDYNQPLIAAEVQRQTANLTPVQTETTDPDLERNQTKHYERADKLGAKDFEETEDAAIAILGKDVVNHFINNSEKSELVLYYLGKNPGRAEEIANLVKSNPVKAMLQLGRLEAELNVKPRGNSEPTPDPDEELSGGSPSAGKTNKHQRAVDAARAKAGETRDMGPLIAAKKAAKEAGVTVI